MTASSPLRKPQNTKPLHNLVVHCTINQRRWSRCSPTQANWIYTTTMTTTPHRPSHWHWTFDSDDRLLSKVLFEGRTKWCLALLPRNKTRCPSMYVSTLMGTWKEHLHMTVTERVRASTYLPTRGLELVTSMPASRRRQCSKGYETEITLQPKRDQVRAMNA